MHCEIEAFSYPDGPQSVLSDIELVLRPGESLLVAGGSGSGKTTLGLILAGVLPGQHRGTLRGRISLGGQSLLFPAAQALRVDHQRWNALVGYAGQDAAAQLSTIAPSVAEEIAFPLENAGMPRHVMQDRVRETAEALGLVPLLDRDPGSLSGGQQKVVGIAAAVARRPDFLVLDEPFAGLDYGARTRVQAALSTLLDEGMGLVLLSQDLDAFRSVAGAAPGKNRVVLLHGGRAVFTGTREEAKEKANALQLPVLPGPAGGPAAAPGTRPFPFSAQGALSGTVSRGVVPEFLAPNTPVLAAEAVHFSYGRRRPRPWRRNVPGVPVVDAVNLTLAAGERLAVTGANGSGKSTLLRLLTGLSVPQEGYVRLPGGGAGKEQGSSGGAVGALLQHPREQLFERTVRREVGAGLPHGPGSAARTSRVDAALRRCGLDDAGELHPYELPASGQRLLALAAVLAQRPDVIALDEPTVSLDAHGLYILAAAIAAEAERGAAIVMVTHDLDFAYRTCSRLMVLEAGRPVADGPFNEVLEEHFAPGVAYGVAAPAAWLR